jgi:hypothetical protein
MAKEKARFESYIKRLQDEANKHGSRAKQLQEEE